MPRSYRQLLDSIPHLGEDAVKRTWKEVRAAPTARFNSKQKRNLIRTLKARKVEKMLQKKIHTVRRRMRNVAGGRKSARKSRKKRRRK